MKHILILSIFIIKVNSFAFVIFDGDPYFQLNNIIPQCSNNQYLKLIIPIYSEVNNSSYEIQKSLDPSFNNGIINLYTISGCGFCGLYILPSLFDYGPFLPNDVWYYRVKATSNSNNVQYKNFVVPYSPPSTINWISQTVHQFINGTSPSNESAYTWTQETREVQGADMSLMPTEMTKVYLELNNHQIRFSSHTAFPFVSLEININNSGYNSIYSGSIKAHFDWQNAATYFNSVGNYNLKVRFTSISAIQYVREYDVYVVPKSDGFFIDNFCNTMRLWKGNDPNGGVPLVLSEGFDAYNVKSEQYYRKAGDV
jgi:hypothetical protein